ncbi:MAG: hypothetical protein COZ17_05570 [Flavobacteriaceae bacterium CG_4_10_14_3_um_filter_33_47]|nr:MAG: hypothetical protein COW44_14930 [Flavobacteriaceae bacterium CG17_big_fil_post_rev_8_21_14_2_50_33_15]PIY11798.1 MAG: hypothetical protein COZ17_05570 [Flavobacteriaceae bacterium CG_4_10_14_3_um_filter_33_47]PJB16757.1 MAG: hypothetical protein CO117_14305 [Flavobacteriaceae bacterium CG_4_9_14_3_um_filter_33_16]
MFSKKGCLNQLAVISEELIVVETTFNFSTFNFLTGKAEIIPNEPEQVMLLREGDSRQLNKY